MISSMVNEADLHDLEFDIPPGLARAVTGLCTLKMEMDRHARDHIGQPFLDDWMGNDQGGTCAYWGYSFLRVVVPFLLWEREHGEAFRARVDVRHVLGANIKGMPEDVERKDVLPRLERYRESPGTKDDAYYVWYRQLGILAAHEGKHRVAFMRAHGETKVAAWVAEARYPDPERIVLVAPTDERDDWLAILDGRYVQVLRRPHVSRVLLGAYGVNEVRWGAVPGLPSEAVVRREICERRLHKDSHSTAENKRTLDLHLLPSATSPDEGISSVMPAFSRLLVTGRLAILASGLAIAMISSEDELVKSAGLVMSGLAAGLLVAAKLMSPVTPNGKIPPRPEVKAG